MSDSVHKVEIDRIVLTDFGMTPERAGGIRALVEVKLQRLLEHKGLLDSVGGSEGAHLHMPTMHLAEPHSDHRLASSLAQGIAQALQGVE